MYKTFLLPFIHNKGDALQRFISVFKLLKRAGQTENNLPIQKRLKDFINLTLPNIKSILIDPKFNGYREHFSSSTCNVSYSWLNSMSGEAQ